MKRTKAPVAAMSAAQKIPPEDLAPPDLIPLDEAARRSGRKIKTLYNWIRIHKLCGKTGLWYVANKPMIDWPLFVQAFFRRAD